MFLNDTWQLWFHDPYDENWEKQSYMSLGTCSTVDEFASIYVSIGKLWTKGMFFWMREHIFPIWEDERNCQGGCFSYKINTNDVYKDWYQTCSYVLGENISKDPADWENICGVSISPKRAHSIVRIWIADKNKCSPNLYNFPLPSYTSVMFKPFQV